MTNTIQLNHFCLDRESYAERLRSSFYRTAFPNLSVKEDPDKSYEHFMQLIRSVNPKLQWDKQWKIRDEQAVREKLSNPKLHIYSLMDNESRVGFAMSRPETRALHERFFSAATGKSVIEMDYLALFHGEEGHGRGRAFFEILFDRLFKEHDIIYWSQYSSNAPSLRNFYENKMGMRLLDTDTIPDFRIS